MNHHDKNLHEAKKSLKYHIKFFESLLTHLRGPNEQMRNRALWASWCLHRYIEDRLVFDIEKAMKENACESPQ